MDSVQVPNRQLIANATATDGLKCPTAPTQLIATSAGICLALVARIVMRILI
jgi:hypothetical protein